MSNQTLTQPPEGDLTRTRPPTDPDATQSSGGSPKLPVNVEIPGYLMMESLGEGGMGVVFKAMQVKLGRIVAVKLVHGGKAASSKELIRFLAEAEAVAAINHPHVVKVFDTGDAGGHPYMAMEYLPGGTLAQKLKASPTDLASPGRKSGESSPLAPRQAADLIRKLALAVQAAHDLQIVHRDLKPGNVLFDANGEPRVVDFGLAKRAGGGDLTATQAVMGTAAYMAPEQAKGESKFVGPAADVWALGVMLYECLSGKRPFTGSHDLEVIRKVIDEEPSSLQSRVGTIPKDLELIARKCLTKDPAARYPTTLALAEDLRRWQHGEPVSVKAAGMAERSLKWVKRNKVASGIMIGILAFSTVTVALLVGLLQAREKVEQFDEIKRLKEKAEQLSKQADAEVNIAIAANAELLAVADERQFGVSFPNIAKHPAAAIPALIAIIEAKSADNASEEDKERLAKQQANAAVALLRMNQPEKVWPLLQHQPDPRVRSYLIHRIAPLGADAKAIIAQLSIEPDISIRRALILSLGEFTEAQFADRQALLPQLKEMYRTDPDAGLHAAVEWLLCTWKQEAWLKQVNDEWAKSLFLSGGRKPPVQNSLPAAGVARRVDTPRSGNRNPGWFVNSQSQSMILIPGPIEFMMGSPETEAGRYSDDENRHPMKINRSFAIAAKPVTLAEYRRFRSDHDMPDPGEKDQKPQISDVPVASVSWYDAMAYCNWLSEREGIPKDQWCYDTLPLGIMRMKPKYLSLSGYRLPTEAEWEYAARAGSGTSRYFGETEDLLPKYAWYERNSSRKTQPVGLLKPNDFGCFDMLGNVWNWNLNIYQTKSQSEDLEDELVFIGTYSRALRGGAFSDNASDCRSSYRYCSVPANRNVNGGFRPARTLTP